ncbi:hypothetical protein BJ322DRAFT_1025609 [Thelephora terrestris]|uniref:Uncharacterized protein n=1 Tax=Thelephora terrestris TaxID=56493 RepID=A0A9P6H2B2_9AGAM|nr:hypothetical protein BJ322DRAFT_1025609 [Thelephora terrestris]
MAPNKQTSIRVLDLFEVTAVTRSRGASDIDERADPGVLLQNTSGGNKKWRQEVKALTTFTREQARETGRKRERGGLRQNLNGPGSEARIVEISRFLPRPGLTEDTSRNTNNPSVRKGIARMVYGNLPTVEHTQVQTLADDIIRGLIGEPRVSRGTQRARREEAVDRVSSEVEIKTAPKSSGHVWDRASTTVGRIQEVISPRYHDAEKIADVPQLRLRQFDHQAMRHPEEAIAHGEGGVGRKPDEGSGSFSRTRH